MQYIFALNVLCIYLLKYFLAYYDNNYLYQNNHVYKNVLNCDYSFLYLDNIINIHSRMEFNVCALSLNKLKDIKYPVIFNVSDYLELRNLKELNSNIILNTKTVYLNKNINLNKLSYQELQELKTKLPNLTTCLNIKDVDIVLRDKKLNMILKN